MSELDALLALLPQGPPARLVQHLDAVEPGLSVTGRACFPPGDRVFDGHLPGRPLVPGVALVEALAQLAGVILVARTGAPAMGYLAGVDRFRFRRLVEPGEVIALEARLHTRLGSAARFSVAAFVGEQPVCDGEITLGGMA